MSLSSRRTGPVRFLPRRVGAQIAALVVMAALFTYIGNDLLIRSFDPRPNGGGSMMNGNVLFAALPVMAEAAPAKRQAVVDLVNLMAPNLNLSFEAEMPVPENARPLHGRAEPERQNQGAPPGEARNDAAPGMDIDRFAGLRLYSLGTSTLDGDSFDQILVVFPDGSGLHAYMPLPPQPPSGWWFSPQFMMGNWLVLLVFVLPLALVWAVLSVSRPLRRFARAAEDFSFDGAYTPLPETGPEEIRVAARALNAMRSRIAVMAADRTRLLSAVGHDLRTPVTRMRLRAEFIPDAEIRAGQLRDLARMETMIDATLSYLRDGQAQGARAPTDLVSLLQAMIDDFADLGADISLSAPERLICTIDPDAFGRMIDNLVQNGLKFGSRVEMRLLAAADDSIEIRVEDDGPGIREAERAEMLKPFVTGDASRSGNRDGFGLGLSIAEAVARAHGGTLTLGDSALGGLMARIVLPRS
ncbi:MAG: HAMP domain-containing protein [Alphaproteobacteria bacterium]|nr:HAMP domain-containing protein [Alphaproteobacteria bacterium]